MAAIVEHDNSYKRSLSPAPKRRSKQIIGVLWRVLLLNVLVCVAKLVVGFLANSASMVADGFHSLSDGAANIVALAGMRIASRPPDEGHPYGHGRYETVTALAIAVMLGYTGLEIMRTTWHRWFNPIAPTVGALEFSVMIITMVVNFSVTVYERRKGKALASDVLTSDAAHTRADLFVSASVVAGFIAVRLGYPAADGVISAGIALLILRSAVQIALQSTYTLCDGAILDTNEVTSAVESINGAVSCHNIRSRGHSSAVYLDLHVHVADEIGLEQAHRLSHEIDHVLRSRFSNVQETLVHLEPVGAEDD